MIIIYATVMANNGVNGIKFRRDVTPLFSVAVTFRIDSRTCIMPYYVGPSQYILVGQVVRIPKGNRHCAYLLFVKTQGIGSVG
jgi:hypothetical protein